MKARQVLGVVLLSFLTIAPANAATGDRAGRDTAGKAGADDKGGRAVGGRDNGSGRSGGGSDAGKKAGGRSDGGNRTADRSSGGGRSGNSSTRDRGANMARREAGSAAVGGSKGPATGGRAPAGHATSPAGGARALDLKPRDTRSEPQKTVDRNMKNAQEVSKAQAADKEKAAMRDTTHVGRLKTGGNTSLGIQTNPVGVNVRISTDPPKKGEKPPPA